MRITSLLLVSLPIALSACKPEAPTPETKAPPPAEATVPPAPEAGVPAPPAPATDAQPGAVLSEADGMALAKKSNCLSCHALDKKLVGPSFKDVAAKYRGDATAEAKMAEKIAKGGSGVWGVVVMPPSPQVSAADRTALARFILSLK